MPRPNLLFIDTNIWLDFYRARNETSLKLLTHAEALSRQLIVTYQLEGEFKKNRQIAIIEGMQELKAPQQIPRIGIFSDAKAPAIIERSRKQTEKRIKALKARIGRVLKNPALHDPVYKTCQRLFHKEDDLNSYSRQLRAAQNPEYGIQTIPTRVPSSEEERHINWRRYKLGMDGRLCHQTKSRFGHRQPRF